MDRPLLSYRQAEGQTDEDKPRAHLRQPNTSGGLRQCRCAGRLAHPEELDERHARGILGRVSHPVDTQPRRGLLKPGHARRKRNRLLRLTPKHHPLLGGGFRFSSLFPAILRLIRD